MATTYETYETPQSITDLVNRVAEMLSSRVTDINDWVDAPKMIVDLHMPYEGRRLFDTLYTTGELRTSNGEKLSQGEFESELITSLFIHGVVLCTIMAPITRLGGIEAQHKFLLSVTSLASAISTELEKKYDNKSK